MIFFSKTPCGCFLISLWYPKTTAKNAGQFAKKNPVTILQIQFKYRCSQIYFKFFGIIFSFAVHEPFLKFAYFRDLLQTPYLD